jgi:tRNA(adenine34) deaminase
MPRMPDRSTDEGFMRQALLEARNAEGDGDVPVGAILVREHTVIARGRNRREVWHDATAHAEIDVLRAGGHAEKSWRLAATTLYVTLEPCAMCAGALVNARVERVVYACRDPKTGAVDSLYAIGRDPRLNHRFEVTSGILEEEARVMLKTFFARRR